MAKDEGVPGGFYRGSDGKFHNAHGDEVDEDGTIIEKPKPAAMSPEDAAAEHESFLADMAELREEPVDANAEDAAALEGETEDETADDDTGGTTTPRPASTKRKSAKRRR